MGYEGWRFLNTGSGNAFFNMAVDEAVLWAVHRGMAPPTFRVYRWEPPAISFGYAQRIEQEVDVAQCRAMGIQLVRRMTGGRAVLHWEELTYSIACPETHPILGNRISDTYRILSEGLVAGLRRIGVVAELERSQPRPIPPRGTGVTSPCFSSPARYEVVVEGRKLIGSAQRRMNEMVLQHGSLLIGPMHKQIVKVLRLDQDDQVARFRRELDERTTCLSEWLSDPVPFDELGEALRRGMAEVLGVKLVPMELSDEEQDRASSLIYTKYGTEAWNFRRMLSRCKQGSKR